MGFFSDLKEDLAQAVNELVPDEDTIRETESVDGVAVQDDSFANELAETAEAEVVLDFATETEVTEETFELDKMLEKLDTMDFDTDILAQPEEPKNVWETLEMEIAQEEQEKLAEESVIDIGVAAELAMMTEDEVMEEADMLAALDALELIEPETETDIEHVDTFDSNISDDIAAESEIVEELAFALEEEKQEEEVAVMNEEYAQETEILEENKQDEGAWRTMEVNANRTISDETAVITQGMVITGDVISEGSMDVIGTINGNIDILGKLNITGSIQGNSKASEIFADNAKITGEIVSEGSVKIGQSTVIIGNITATSAVIAGAVKGDIDVKGPVVLDTSAIVMGNIKSKSVQINNGAVIEGMCSQCYADVNPTSFFEEIKKKSGK